MNTYETLFAIDPGASGAIANYDLGTGDLDDVTPFTTWKDAAAALKAGTKPVVLIERVWASPIMGVSAAFAFGENYGGWIALIQSLGIPCNTILPQEWQKPIGIPAGTQGAERKRALKQQAEIFSGRKLTLKTCDAVLLGGIACQHYQVMGVIPGKELS